MVYVINIEGKPLMPCNNVIASCLLLKQGKAKIKSKTPFTIKLLYEATNHIQDLTHGIDMCSAYIGSAVVNSENEVVYMSQVEIRNDISDRQDVERSKYRRSRRNRKTRYQMKN